MNINFHHWHSMDTAAKDRLLRRSAVDLSRHIAAVQPVIEAVRAEGDAALIRYEKQFNTVDLDAARLKVSAAEMDAAWAQVPQDVKDTIAFCADNVRRHNQAALAAYGHWRTEILPGVVSGERAVPVASVGLYVPGAKNSFPSTVYMLGVPAQVACVPHVAMITQARIDGTVNPVTLAAARIAGIETLYKISGAHGIAALAFGTDTVKPVDKILGPGGVYALAAKLLVPQYRLIDIGFPAGPSESIVLCDETADPANTVLDMLNEAEHGPDSAGILVTHDAALAEQVRAALPAAINALPEPQKSYCTEVMQSFGAIIVTRALAESIDMVNQYAPEHVLVKLRDPESAVPQLTNAAAILIGEMTPNTLANFALGSNHSLPTGSAARGFSGASITEFLKFVQVSQVTTRAGYDAVAGPAAHMARLEGFPAHERAVTARRLPKGG